MSMGRPKGSQNRTTADFKQAVTKLLNTQNIAKLFKDVPPERRVEVLCKLAEFAFPKLGRTEVTGENGGPLVVEFPPIPKIQSP
jgi:hypothetical protein